MRAISLRMFVDHCVYLSRSGLIQRFNGELIDDSISIG
jgi:hypothetical protein